MDDPVEVGEMTVQYTADSDAAKREIDEFRREVNELVSSLGETSAVIESYSFPEFDARLSWDVSEQDTDTEDE